MKKLKEKNVLYRETIEKKVKILILRNVREKIVCCV